MQFSYSSRENVQVDCKNILLFKFTVNLNCGCHPTYLRILMQADSMLTTWPKCLHRIYIYNIVDGRRKYLQTLAKKLPKSVQNQQKRKSHNQITN